MQTSSILHPPTTASPPLVDPPGEGMSDSRFRALIEKSSDIIVVVNGEGCIVYQSPSIEHYFGITDAENLGKNAFEYIYKDDVPRLAEMFMEVLESPCKPISIQTRAISNDRLIWLEGIVTNLLDTDGIHGIVCNFRDVTERKESEKMVRESEDLSRRLEQQLAEEKLRWQKQILQATIDAQEKEREEIGRELHDNVNQILTTARLYLDCLNGTPEQWPIIKRSSEIITSAIEEIRKLSSSMTQSFHKELGLKLSIEDLLESIGRLADGPRTSLDFFLDDEFLLDDKLKTTLFRIIQEQLNNVLKHASATVVAISLRQKADQLFLLISDNGRGFDPHSKRQGIGINNIITRTEAFNGRVNIESSPGKGCSLSVQIQIS